MPTHQVRVAALPARAIASMDARHNSKFSCDIGCKYLAWPSPALFTAATRFGTVRVRATADQAIAPSSRSRARPSAKHLFVLVKGQGDHGLWLPPLEVPLAA